LLQNGLVFPDREAALAGPGADGSSP